MKNIFLIGSILAAVLAANARAVSTRWIPRAPAVGGRCEICQRLAHDLAVIERGGIRSHIAEARKIYARHRAHCTNHN